jgi:ribosomal protein L16
MLSPKRTKFRKAHKGRIHGNAKGGTQLNFGAYGLKAVTPERVTARQIEAARRAITRHLRLLNTVQPTGEEICCLNTIFYYYILNK